MPGIFDFLGGIVSPITKLVDSLHTSEGEKLAIKAELLRAQTEFAAKALDYEKRLFEVQGDIITTESKADSWLTRSWRPLTMMTFVGLVVWFYMGKTFNWPTPDDLFVGELFGLIKLGLGGYVIGRSVEKVIPSVVGALKAKEE